MDTTKRKRLKKTGWQVGSVQDFLGLSAKEVEYIELKLALAQCLENARRSRRLTQVQLAKKIKSSQSRVAKMEAGDPSVSLDLLVRSLLELEVPRREIFSFARR